jgi:hypothetical protein
MFFIPNSDASFPDRRARRSIENPPITVADYPTSRFAGAGSQAAAE